eukprot:TRINITY_DN230_c0_g2_i1.p1 TRINITY_DN230_c0_g2~~TRINITY_DN230_c0_g2_i1.p1  ORF type:complete len:170 (-),score=42.89 TRINITY_DN230_c0_g2_i1:139-579(-)
MAAGNMAQKKPPPGYGPELPKINLNGTTCSGWLEKQTRHSGLKKYVKRFFVLRGPVLEVYKKAGNVAIGSDLRKWMKCEEFHVASGEVLVHNNPDGKREYQFTVDYPGPKKSSITLSAEDDETRNTWTNALSAIGLSVKSINVDND